MSIDIARDVLSKLSQPALVFDADRSIAVSYSEPDEEAMMLFDAVSYENGATGVLLLARMLGDRELAREYSDWIEGQLVTALNHTAPGAQTSLIGADVATHLAPRGSALNSRATRIRRLIHKKTDFEIVTLGRAIDARGMSPGFWAHDALAGLGRSVITLANSSDEDSPERLVRGAEVLMRLLVPNDAGLLGGVAGPPFYGREGDDLESHWNLGFAHGATGIAFALVRVGEYLRREERPTEDIQVSVRTYCEWLVSRFGNGDVPMYVHDRSGHAENVANGGVPSWCYGTTGHALLMLSAGRFLEDSALVELGVDTALLSLERISSLADNSLCHGLAGVLAMITAGQAASRDPRLVRAELMIREQIIASYSAQKKYGFDYTPRHMGSVPVPGLLNGAAGVAIALCQSAEGMNRIEGAPWLCAPSGLLPMV